ncbi:hypothetical protein FIBSPDRAFT_923299 [Athelia psychrophila]|uniref:T6SS Phospholipase effector Tle1-like catalytic domain-containing protein n=1 Tax=Athelia psychrophila TaxID=1759441 RepID=A0A167V5K4_9AGAM|nr:hypothetical protein FIBSPDRAFT_923299 [Fibularhizoctonia sp. CBS 109695]
MTHRTVIIEYGGTATGVPGQGVPIDNRFDDIIPHPDEVDHRNLVLCFDGTGDQFDSDNSNIVEFFSMLKREDVTQQLVYYQAGIGTYTIPEIASSIGASFQKLLDMMIGIHLDAHIMGGYEFLMQNYKAGDKIFIFGFSRGAYTARALAGMIHKIGLLPPCNHQQVPFAYKMYSQDDELGWRQSNAFKKTFSIDVDIEMVGVWDTVGSVGIIPRRLPFTKSNSHIRFFRHAISLDERRARFKVNLWNRPTEEDHAKGVKKGEMPRHKTPERRPGFHHADTLNGSESTSKSTKHELERKYADLEVEQPTDIKEVWFSGAHCDVGGGSVANGTRHSLARIPLRWMIRQCFILKTGLLFHSTKFKEVGIDPATIYPHVLERPPPIQYTPETLASRYEKLINFATDSKETVNTRDPFINEEEEDLLDSLTPIYDQLRLAPFWWVLELLPNKHRYQKADDSWTAKRGVNLGKGRTIPKQVELGVNVHRTVRTRMSAKDLFMDEHENLRNYVPAATWDIEPQWAD